MTTLCYFLTAAVIKVYFVRSQRNETANSGITTVGTVPSKTGTSKPVSLITDTSDPVSFITATSEPVSSKTDTSEHVSSKTITSEPLSSKTATSEPVSSKTITSEPVSSKTDTSEPVSSKTDTSEPESSKTTTAEPVSSKTTTSEPVTSKSATFETVESKYSTNVCATTKPTPTTVASSTVLTDAHVPDAVISYSPIKGLRIRIPAKPWFSVVYVHGFLNRSADHQDEPIRIPPIPKLFDMKFAKPDKRGQWEVELNDCMMESGDTGFLNTVVHTKDHGVYLNEGQRFVTKKLPTGMWGVEYLEKNMSNPSDCRVDRFN